MRYSFGCRCVRDRGSYAAAGGLSGKRTRRRPPGAMGRNGARAPGTGSRCGESRTAPRTRPRQPHVNRSEGVRNGKLTPEMVASVQLLMPLSSNASSSWSTAAPALLLFLLGAPGRPRVLALALASTLATSELMRRIAPGGRVGGGGGDDGAGHSDS